MLNNAMSVSLPASHVHGSPQSIHTSPGMVPHRCPSSNSALGRRRKKEEGGGRRRKKEGKRGRMDAARVSTHGGQGYLHTHMREHMDSSSSSSSSTVLACRPPSLFPPWNVAVLLPHHPSAEPNSRNVKFVRPLNTFWSSHTSCPFSAWYLTELSPMPMGSATHLSLCFSVCWTVT